jgi:acetyl esterase/lipase
MAKKTLTEAQKNKKYPMRLANFHPGWMDMNPDLPEPNLAWIEKQELDVAFGDDPLQKLDLYYPNNRDQASYPCLIIIHGGGWSGMDKRDWHLYPGFFALEKGYMVASLNYRLAPKNKFPDGWNDVNAGLEYLINHASELHINLENIFFWGASAGGNFDAMLSLKYANDPRLRIGGVACLCPVLDFKDQFEKIGKHHLGNLKPKWFFHLLIKVVIKKMGKNYFGYWPNFQTSPVNPFDASFYIGAKIPPFYFQYGALDPLIIPSVVEDFAAKLIEKGAKPKDIVLDCLAPAAHMGAGVHYFEEPNIQHYLQFFTEHLK